MSPSLLGAALLVVGSSRSALAAPLTADDVVRAALVHHPDAVEARSAVDAEASARREVAWFVANPEASAAVAVVGERVDLSALQPLSLTGEGWHARDAARARVDAATASAHRADLVVAAEARAAWSRAVTAHARWELADQALTQASRLADAVGARADAGESTGLDARLARLAEAESAADAILARRDLAAAIEALVRFDPDAATAELGPDPTTAVPDGSATGSTRSDRVAADASVTAAHAELARARAAAFPAVGVGVSAERDEGGWAVGPAIGLVVPVWGRNQAAVGAARAHLLTATAERDAVTAVADAEGTAAPEVAAYADHALGSLGDLEADAKAALDAIERGWTSGDLALDDALLLRHQVLDGWSAGIEARQQTVEARLDALLAVEDPNLLPPESP